MRRGFAIHIGLNSVDPAGYAGWDGKLQACVNDARAMAGITDQLGYRVSRTLLDSQATSAAILGSINEYRQQMQAGDLLKISYSGHGGQMADPWGLYRTVETWCAWDRQILGHELAQLWAAFPRGSRVCVVSDSCHAGTVTRENKEVLERICGLELRELKNIPDEVQTSINAQQRPELVRQFRGVIPPRAAVPIYLLGACESNQLSSDGRVNGLYTEKLLQVWAAGTWVGDYPNFVRRIRALMPPWQSPVLFVQGPTDLTYYHSRPFSV